MLANDLDEATLAYLIERAIDEAMAGMFPAEFEAGPVLSRLTPLRSHARAGSRHVGN